jgi:2,3-bisphosphoglycerate-dependent phosphoglycerate mutase
MKTRNLILVRHGQSEWNEQNLFTGWKDPGLTELGIKEAKNAGSLISDKGIQFDEMFTSMLVRAQDTGAIILDSINQQNIPITKNQALNERNYGSLAGLNKDDARKKWGEEQVHIWRRSFDIPPPEGESLKIQLKEYCLIFTNI